MKLTLDIDIKKVEYEIAHSEEISSVAQLVAIDAIERMIAKQSVLNDGCDRELCPHCGGRVYSEDGFCQYCGQKYFIPEERRNQ